MKAKNKLCVECGRDDLPHFSKKRCIHCAKKGYGKLSKSVKPKKEKPELDGYYEYLIAQSIKFPYSHESGLLIPRVNRSNICHLFPKRYYQSLSTNPKNFTLLTLDEHTLFDDLIDKRDFERLEQEFPKTFRKLVNVYNEYKDAMEYGKLVESLEQYLKSKEIVESYGKNKDFKIQN